ncbi:MAG: hypothetical protein ACQEWU_05290 [Bacillota bacterium]
MKKISSMLLVGILSIILIPQVSFANEINGKLQELKKAEIIPNDGVDLEVDYIKHYYKSINGEKIEYTKENKDRILKQKIKDLKKFNSKRLYGQKELTLRDIGTGVAPEFTVKETGNEAVIKMSPQEDKGVFGTLPPADREINGDLMLVQNVNYLRRSGNNYRYLYNSYAEWFSPPAVTTKDAFASAWDVDAVGINGSFDSQLYMYSSGVGPNNPGYEETVNLEPDPDEHAVYGNGVEFNIDHHESITVYMNREISVSGRKVGDPASIVTKYHHTTFNNPIGSIGINLGPSSVTFDGFDGGDVTYVGYNYKYGDTN